MKYYLTLVLVLSIGWLLGTYSERGCLTSAHAQPAVKKPVDSDPKMMETVGLVTTLYLYQTYLNVGLLADCKAEGVYEEKQVKQILGSIIAPLDAVEKQLQGIAKTASTKTDRDSIEKMQTIISPLRRQGQELQKYWETDNGDHAKRYEASRKEAWQNLSVLMGVK